MFEDVRTTSTHFDDFQVNWVNWDATRRETSMPRNAGGCLGEDATDAALRGSVEGSEWISVGLVAAVVHCAHRIHRVHRSSETSTTVKINTLEITWVWALTWGIVTSTDIRLSINLQSYSYHSLITFSESSSRVKKVQPIRLTAINHANAIRMPHYWNSRSKKSQIALTVSEQTWDAHGQSIQRDCLKRLLTGAGQDGVSMQGMQGCFTLTQGARSWQTARQNVGVCWGINLDSEHPHSILT